MSNASSTPKIYQWQHNLIMGLQAEFGIQTRKYVIHSNRMNLVFSSQEFTQSKNPPQYMKFVGPVTGRPGSIPFDWEKLQKASSPKVFVSLGTLLVDIREAFFRKLIEAFADQPLTIIAATDPGILDKWPENFIVQRFVPQSQLMSKVDAVICHGGFNTVNDTFLHGLPMVIMPMAYDQFHTAYLVENAGCGIRLRYKRLRVNDLKEALWEILSNKQYRMAAAKIRDTFIKAGGTERAVSYLEEFAQSTKATEKEHC
jgi:MGT family glycosyltransferase